MARSQRDVILLFSARSVRLFAYGALSVILALYLHDVGLSGPEIGLLFTLTLFGDAGISLWITTTADRLGRKRMLLLGASLMILAGVVFILTGNFILLSIGAIIGVISPSGNEIGPFLSLEQAALSQLLPAEQRVRSFALYNLAGSLATAAGALAAGFVARALINMGLSELASYRAVILVYAVCGIAIMLIFVFLSPAVEAADTLPAKRLVLGLHKSRNMVMKLSALFALDAFAGGFVIQSMVAYWFHLKFGVHPAVIGSIFFGANILAGVSALLAATIAKRIGLINTMVFTHIPSNVLLCLVPLMPDLSLAVVVLLCRFSISQMDVPTRQSYTMAVVAPDERSAASGVTTIARSLGAAVSPALTGLLLAFPALMSFPFLASGSLKICYDLLLYKSFKNVSEA
ncbi:MAG TPA: MFS transporter [Nitrospirota bacterium]|nr:MFS transporter [Nitrospirota bacterium]